MAGLDHHAGLYYFNVFTGLSVPPAPPIPYPPSLLPWPPFSFHPVFGTSRWPMGNAKTNETVIADGNRSCRAGMRSNEMSMCRRA